jgi:hypothetical protein
MFQYGQASVPAAKRYVGTRGKVTFLDIGEPSGIEKKPIEYRGGHPKKLKIKMGG